MRALLRVIGVIFALVLASLVGASPGSSALPSGVTQAYTYDSGHHTASTMHTTTDRGPPAAYDGTTTYDAADQRSHGASARPDVATQPTTYNYDHGARHEQTVRVGARLDVPAQGVAARHASLATGRVAAKGATGAYDEALAGGKHAGFLENYLGTPTPQIQRGITSIEKQIAEHQAKIRNPGAYIDDWASLDPRQQQALLNSKWPGDIARQQEQLDILRGILGSR